MIKFALFGVRTETLEEAKLILERKLNVSLRESEGLQSGGTHYTLRLPSKIIDLKNNLDLDDTENECNGLSEPDFPNYNYLLYVNFIDEYPRHYQLIEEMPELFIRLRVR